jgi:hypothetical protein
MRVSLSISGIIGAIGKNERDHPDEKAQGSQNRRKDKSGRTRA